MRKHYIDNLRNLTILLLFPVHTFMIWNDFGSGFYIWQGENKLLSTLIVLLNPWFMPILFVLAGMSARYALDKQSNKEFVIQRIHKLLIPFIFGMILIVPFQIVFRFMPYSKAEKQAEKIPLLGVLLFFIPIWLMYYLGNFGGFSLGKSLALFLIGFYFLSNDVVMETMERNIKWLAILWGMGTVMLVVLYYRFSFYGDLWINFIGWVSIMVLLVLGKKFLDKETRFTKYFNSASYSIYILHQSILVALAYYVVRICDNLYIQIFSICVGSFVLTILTYHFIRLIPIVRKIVGVK